MDKDDWLLCPVCKNKTRTKIRNDTVLLNFPLFCPKCKREILVNVQQMNITIIKEPDARRRADNM
ncbi:MAG: cysteine-rich KTR domain-containing protein [Firmicutes bacterium]|nr:cysteine-rich KTR domain-containing protein [Bacillota bacterium]